MSDIYPGWDEFFKLIQELLRKATDHGDDIAQKLVGEAKKVPKDHRCACDTITEKQIKDALSHPEGIDYDWSHWVGKFDGSWYDENQKEYADPQEWQKPDPCETEKDDAIPGVPSNEKCKKQHVNWAHPPGSDKEGARKREGWNVSSSGKGYVWGWDPKEEKAPTRHGQDGTHVGFPLKHENGKCWCIVWLTLKDEYLECITADGKCRTSVGLHGHGKWTRI